MTQAQQWAGIDGSTAEEKKCSTCQRMLSLGQFGADLRAKDGRQSRCKECYASARRKECAEHPDRSRERYARKRTQRISETGYASARTIGAVNAQLKYKYGLNISDVELMREWQGNRCAICGTRETETKRGRLVIDHDHDTGAVRSLLCHNCNRALGEMRDDPSLLRVAADYLERFRSASAKVG